MKPLAAALGLVLAGCLACSVFAQPAPRKSVDLRFRDVEIRDVLQIVARLASRNLLMGREVRGRLTMDLTGVDPIKAIHLIAAVNRYEVLYKDGILIVGDPATISFIRGAGEVEVVPLAYGNAVELADKLAKLYKGKLEISADPATNSLLIVRPGK